MFMTRSRNLGMRILGIMVCVMCLLSMMQPAAAVPAGETVAQTLTAVVRLGASSGSTPIGQLENGTMVTVLDQRGDYYKIDCYDMTGYIAKTQLIHTEDDEYYVNCTGDSSENRLLTYTDHAAALALRHSLLALAKKQLGYPYVYGGARPGGFDCSGLMYYLFGQHDIGLHRSASQQLQDGIIIPKEALQVGDLIFFREPGKGYPASHVGVYAGNNQIIHAGSKGIAYADLDMDYYADYYLCARRIVNTNAATQLEETSTVSAASGALTANSVSGRTAH